MTKTNILFALLVPFASLLTAGEARAATQSGCTVATIQYDNSQRLAIWCSGVSSIHYAFGSSYGSACSPVSVDTTKVWESMLQSALLSGKKVDLDYTTNSGCFNGTVRIVTQLRLQAQ